MDRRITATVDAAPSAVIAALSDLATYPAWLSLVLRAEPDGVDVWHVTLRAKLGRLARSKRLRMARVASDDHMVKFERQETDGRDHAVWTLVATVAAITDDQCQAEVHLHYGGALWSTPLEIVLSSFEGTAADRLEAYLTDA